MGNAAAVMLVRLITNPRYGFDRNDLQSQTGCATSQLGVSCPVAIREKIHRGVFELSLVGLRFFLMIA
jgi:hypothetical protein